MRFRRPIYRILFFAAWVVVLGGITTLVIAANRKTQSRTCKGIVVTINGEGEKIFIEKEDVLKNIQKTAKGSLVKKPIGNIRLGGLESSLEKNAWISDAKLYFDTKDVLHIAVSERQPMARVFTTAGSSFYIDSAGYQLPLLETYSAKLPVVTGFTAAKKLNKRDSMTLQGLKEIVQVVTADQFWNAQVGQIDITPEGKFELVPVVGGHIIKLGYGENVVQKLDNLMVFYKQVLPKAGLAKYSALDVQFEGQVVAVRKGPTSMIDSLQLQKNIEELMKKKAAEQEPEDMTQAVPAPATGLTTVSKDSLVMPAAIKETAVPEKTAVTPTPKKKTIPKSNPVKKPTINQQKRTVKKPKAVMPSKPGNGY